MAKQKTDVVKVSAATTRPWWRRSLFTPSMESIINKKVKKGWTLKSTTPINNHRGKTTHYLLTFEKE
jgi:hypothetical protein